MFIHYDVVCGPVGKSPFRGKGFTKTSDLDDHLCYLEEF